MIEYPIKRRILPYIYIYIDIELILIWYSLCSPPCQRAGIPLPDGGFEVWTQEAALWTHSGILKFNILASSSQFPSGNEMPDSIWQIWQAMICQIASFQSEQTWQSGTILAWLLSLGHSFVAVDGSPSCASEMLVPMTLQVDIHTSFATRNSHRDEQLPWSRPCATCRLQSSVLWTTCHTWQFLFMYG